MSTITAVLIENNPYDRAVIDAMLANDPGIQLLYTDSKDMEPLGMCLKGWREHFEGRKPDVALLDLALLEQCEAQLSSHDFQKQVEKLGKSIRHFCLHLVRSGSPEELARMSFDICRALRGTDEQRRTCLVGLGANRNTLLGETIKVLLGSDAVRGLSPEQRLKSCLATLWSEGELHQEVAKLLTHAPSL